MNRSLQSASVGLFVGREGRGWRREGRGWRREGRGWRAELSSPVTVQCGLWEMRLRLSAVCRSHHAAIIPDKYHITKMCIYWCPSFWFVGLESQHVRCSLLYA
eukprot:365801-Chlamydomonas_euryale.AAC.7